MDGPIDKDALRAELHAILDAERDKLLAAHKTSAEGVTHADAKADGSKDMRATEASYIARGQALRVQQLSDDVAMVASMPLRDFGDDDRIGLSAVVTVAHEDGGTRRVWLAPAGGGVRLAVGIEVTTTQAPLGRALTGARRGDIVELDRVGGPHEIEIVDVR